MLLMCWYVQAIIKFRIPSLRWVCLRVLEWRFGEWNYMHNMRNAVYQIATEELTWNWIAITTLPVVGYKNIPATKTKNEQATV